MKKINVGLVGCGYIGGALKKWLEEHNPSVNIFVLDPYKGFNDDLSNSDIIFISIHIPTENDGSQDLSLMERIINTLPNKPIFIRTTVLPGTSERLSKKYKKNIYFMPEFLTQRSAYEDFCSQTMIFTGEVDLLSQIFVGKKYIVMSSIEAELAKYTHNVFGALKVTYFNGIYNLCQKMHINYKNVQAGTLVSGYINSTHTFVPGPDGKTGYGGKCFPKDVNAFYSYCSKDQDFASLLGNIIKLNSIYRVDTGE